MALVEQQSMIKRKTRKINKLYATTGFVIQQEGVMRMGADDKLDEALYLWFVKKRSQGIIVSGPVLCANYWNNIIITFSDICRAKNNIRTFLSFHTHL